MCHALPVRIVAIDKDSDMATVDLGGVKKEISIALIDNVSVGDYVIVHVGFALQKLNIAEAERTLSRMAEIRPAFQVSANSGQNLRC